MKAVGSGTRAESSFGFLQPWPWQTTTDLNGELKKKQNKTKQNKIKMLY